MNDFQQYPYSKYLVDCWRNNRLLLRDERDYIFRKINDFNNTNNNQKKGLLIPYMLTLIHFSATLEMQDVQNFNLPPRTVYVRNQLRNPWKLKEHQDKKYERIKWTRQVRKWLFDLEHQQALVDIVKISLSYQDVNQMDIHLTKIDFMKRTINVKGRVDLNRLKELAESMLETTKSHPPVIRRSHNHSDAKILKQIEEITDEIKKTKRMTFKSTEEIKQSLSQMVASPLEETDNTDRESYVTTMLEIYDVLFYLARMLQKNQPGQLASEVMNQLVHVENILRTVDLEVIQTIGKMLDPEIMEGVGTVPQSHYSHLKEYYVADEILRGFKDGRNDKLIREAKVITVLN